MTATHRDLEPGPTSFVSSTISTKPSAPTGVLGPIFDDIAQTDWAVHLPKMYAFWETVLFGRSAGRICLRGHVRC